jgi:hypothetical protein
MVVLRREIQDIVYYKDYNTTNHFFQLAMLAEKELQEHQQKNQTNIGDNLNQVLAKVEQAFARIETKISRRVAASAATAASSPPPPTSILKHDKILNLVKIVQLHIENVSIENEEIDTKNENHQVPKLKDSSMFTTKSNIAKTSDDVLNLSTTDAIIGKHLVDTKSEFPLLENNCSDNVTPVFLHHLKNH